MKKNKIFWFGTIVTTSMHCLNRLYATMGTAKKILEAPEDCTYDWRFGKIRYRKQGKGTPILLLHNETPGSSLYEFQKLANLLSTQFEVYSLDLLGYGLSEKPSITYTNFLYVELVNDFIKNVIQKKTDIITSGHSAMIAIKVASQNKESIRKIMLINPPDLYQMNAIPSNQTKLMKYILSIPVIGTFMYHLYVSESQIKEQFEENYFYDKKKIKENDIIAYIEASNHEDLGAKQTLASFYGKYMNTNIINDLKTIDHSIMILTSKEKKNQETLIENYQYYNAAIEKVSIEKVKDLPHMENPHAIYHLVKIYFI